VNETALADREAHRVAASNYQPAMLEAILHLGGRRRDYAAVRNCFICNADALFSTGRQVPAAAAARHKMSMLQDLERVTRWSRQCVSWES
jgi:hypothetical protein